MSKKKVKSNTSINCDVVSCEHNNCEEGTCQLEKVDIGCSSDNDKCMDSCDTVCQSFKSTASNITDNEYEVLSEVNNYDIDEEEDM